MVYLFQQLWDRLQRTSDDWALRTTKCIYHCRVTDLDLGVPIFCIRHSRDDASKLRVGDSIFHHAAVHLQHVRASNIWRDRSIGVGDEHLRTYPYHAECELVCASRSLGCVHDDIHGRQGRRGHYDVSHLGSV